MANNKFCIECRFELPITAKFCERCGFTFVLNQSTSESEPEIKQDKQPSTQPVTETPKDGIDAIETFIQSSTRKKSRGNRMDFLTSLKVCHTKYADFEGTASRSEYWWFYLYTWLLIPFCFIPYVQILFIIIALTTVIPYMAVAVRRMHDLNYSGWRILWGLIPLLGTILLIVWYSKEGNLNKTVSSHSYEYDHKSIEEKKVDESDEESEIITKAKAKAKSEGKTILLLMAGIPVIILLVILAYIY